MGNMRDALNKGGLLSKKDQKRLAHEERVRRKQVGREGLEQEQREREQELQEKRSEAREQTRATQQELEAARQAAAERAACLDLLQREVHKRGHGQGQPFFVELEDGSLPGLQLGAVERQNLLAGALCLVRVGPAGSHDYGLLATEHARRVRKIFPDRVVWAAAGVLG